MAIDRTAACCAPSVPADVRTSHRDSSRLGRCGDLTCDPQEPQSHSGYYQTKGPIIAKRRNGFCAQRSQLPRQAAAQADVER